MSTEPNQVVEKKSWNSDLKREHWRVLWATLMGWTFDGYETYALLMVAGVAAGQLLPAADHPHIKFYIGLSIGMTLLGWALGGIVGGVVADYLGRKKTMMYSMLFYALFTGLTALSHNFTELILFRILTGIGIGSEWATGASMVAESWPNRARAKGAGFMQAGFGIGTFMASFLWLILNPLGGAAWRYMFLFGVIPALLTLFIRRSVKESERWLKAKEERKKIQRNKNTTNGETAIKSAFTLAAVFKAPKLRKFVLLGFLMSLSTTLGWWGIATWVPTYASTVATKMHLGSPQHWASVSSMLYNLGAIIGYVTFGFIVDKLGRKWTISLLFIGSIFVTYWLYAWSHSMTALIWAAFINGFFTLGQFAWFAVYLPELFPTSVRATASGFIFNASRLIAFIGPLTSGILISKFNGFGNLATSMGWIYLIGLIALFFMPETKNKPLPE